MDRTLYGMMCFLSGGRQFTETALKVGGIVESMLPTVSLSHYSVSTDPIPTPERLLKYGRGALERVSKFKDAQFMALASIRKDVPEIDRTYADFYLSLATAEGRCDGCLVLELQVSKRMLKSIDILGFTDELASTLRVESGFLHDLEDHSDQNELGPYWFSLKGIEIPPERIKYSEVLGREIMDVEQNPCHSHVVGPVTFTSAWTMYLGRQFLASVNSSRLSSVGGEVVRLGEGLVRATLFDDPFAYAAPPSIEMLWSFRNKLGIDEAAHQHVTLL